MWRLSVALLGIMLVMMLGSIWYATQSVVTTTLNGESISMSADGIDIDLLADDAEAATGTIEVTSLKAPDISPTSIKLGYKTEFFIKAVLPTDVVLADARVQVLKSTGKWATLGKLHDDGQLGDVAGDGKMYLAKTFKVKNPTLVFRVRAMESKGKYRISPQVILGNAGSLTVPQGWQLSDPVSTGIGLQNFERVGKDLHGGAVPYNGAEVSIGKIQKIAGETLSQFVAREIDQSRYINISNQQTTIQGNQAIEILNRPNSPYGNEMLFYVYVDLGDYVIEGRMVFGSDHPGQEVLKKQFRDMVASLI